MYKHFTYVLYTFIICAASQVYGQTLSIRDAETGFPLAQVMVQNERNPTQIALSDENGRLDLAFLNDSVVAFVASLEGYEKQRFTLKAVQAKDFLLLMQPRQLTLDQVVVSANRWSRPGRTTPGHIAAIKSADVALQNPQTAADLLGISGQVFIQKSQQGGGSPMIRGFSTNRLLIAVDGVRMNTAIFRSGNLQNVISLDPFAISKAEVLFGPGSVMYGSDAIGGVMSFYTLQPAFSTNAHTKVGASGVLRYATANEEMTGHIDATISGKKWAFLSSLSHNNFGDLRMGKQGPAEYLRPIYGEREGNNDVVRTNSDPRVQIPTGYEQINLMQKIRYKAGKNWDLGYALHYSATGAYSRYDRLVRYRNGAPRSAEWNYGPQKWLFNHFSAYHTRKNALYDEMRIGLAYQFFEESRIDRDFNDSERRRRLEKVDAYSANADFSKAVGQQGQWYYGLETVFNKVHSSGTDEDIRTGSSRPGPARYPQADWVSLGAYTSYQHRVNKEIALQAGLRYSYFSLNARFDTTFFPFPFVDAEIAKGSATGSLGAVWRPAEKLVVSLNLSTGFRSPNVDDMGKVFDSEPGNVTVPNPDLSPEYAYNAELGVARIFAERLKLDLTGYYTLLDQALVRRNFTLGNRDSILYNGELSQVQAIQNAAEAKVYGIQAGLELKLIKGLALQSYLNFQEGEEELDDGSKSPLRHAAPWSGLSRLTYSAKKFKVDFYAVYNGEVSYENLADEERSKPYIYAEDHAGRPYSPSWYTLNLKGIYSVSKAISMTCGVENITNQRYRPYSSGIAAAGQNWILSLRAAI